MKESFRDLTSDLWLTWRGLVGTWRLIRDWSDLLTFRCVTWWRGDGRWGKRKKTKRFFFSFWYPIQGPGRMARAPQVGKRADFAVITGQLWTTITVIFSWVNNFVSTVIYDLDPGITSKYSKRQISSYSMQVSFRFHSLRCSEILVSRSICTKIRTWRFHRTEEVSNNFSVSWHITHISMVISANLGRDTGHNSTKLVCAHPLLMTSFFTTVYDRFDWKYYIPEIQQFQTFKFLG